MGEGVKNMASKRKLRRNECGDKIQYASYKEATDAAYSLKRNKGGTLCLPYLCTWGNHIHIGHEPQTVQSGIRRAERRKNRDAEIEQARIKGVQMGSKAPAPDAKPKKERRSKKTVVLPPVANPRKVQQPEWVSLTPAERQEYQVRKHKEVVLGYNDHSAALDEQLKAILGNNT